MIAYKSPYLAKSTQPEFLFKMQASGTTPLIPECNDQSSCNSEALTLGVISCDPGSTTSILINVFLPNQACSTAPECSVTNVLENGTPVTNLACDASLTECSEGGCQVLFSCDLTPVGDANCDQYTASIQCADGGSPVSCENNIVP
jgi:hypothetical protein